MAHLAIVGSHKVNGVAALHTQLLKEQLFADFHRLYPDRFINITNGITPRLWLHQANRGLSALLDKQLGDGWKSQLHRLRGLETLHNDDGFRQQVAEVKRVNKGKLARLIARRLDIEIDPDSMFDVQIKRIHEYKRQLLNVVHCIARYNRIREGRADGLVPRTVIIAGKAAPGYAMAKLIIKLIHDVGDIINQDPRIEGRLKLVFIPNYDVSTASEIIPAADLSQQISTAGTEASGTGNMKLALNGALTIGTLDGANIEIRDEVGRENIFIFGNTVESIAQLHAQGYNPWDYYHGNGELRQALDMLASGFFCPDEPGRFRPLVENLLQGGDPYMIMADFADYIATQEAADRLYADPASWQSKVILNVARMGRFSTDRTIGEYAGKIWGLTGQAPAPLSD
jgi:starch phosphorylase